MRNKNVRRTGIVLLVACLTVSDAALGTRLAASQLNVWQTQIVEQLERSQTLTTLLRQGFVLQERTALLGYLGDDGRETRAITFESGFRHVLIGKCDNDCNDLDFALYDPYGNLVAQDTLRDDTPVIRFSARLRGTYRLEVSMAGCFAPIGCHWGGIVVSSARSF
jgi:hypothetical protein